MEMKSLSVFVRALNVDTTICNHSTALRRETLSLEKLLTKTCSSHAPTLTERQLQDLDLQVVSDALHLVSMSRPTPSRVAYFVERTRALKLAAFTHNSLRCSTLKMHEPQRGNGHMHRRGFPRDLVLLWCSVADAVRRLGHRLR